MIRGSLLVILSRRSSNNNNYNTVIITYLYTRIRRKTLSSTVSVYWSRDRVIKNNNKVDYTVQCVLRYNIPQRAELHCTMVQYTATC